MGFQVFNRPVRPLPLVSSPLVSLYRPLPLISSPPHLQIRYSTESVDFVNVTMCS
uniref:Uncharacterized protein n=1 Tax=Arundo donax TaxID=35708 RepID=A0A0A9D031_ARUDO